VLFTPQEGNALTVQSRLPSEARSGRVGIGARGWERTDDSAGHCGF
jgi:hypothetical protein